jgi:hypothetical protein
VKKDIEIHLLKVGIGAKMSKAIIIDVFLNVLDDAELFISGRGLARGN